MGENRRAIKLSIGVEWCSELAAALISASTHSRILPTHVNRQYTTSTFLLYTGCFRINIEHRILNLRNSWTSCISAQ